MKLISQKLIDPDFPVRPRLFHPFHKPFFVEVQKPGAARIRLKFPGVREVFDVAFFSSR
jgi:hypothetical protein